MNMFHFNEGLSTDLHGNIMIVNKINPDKL